MLEAIVLLAIVFVPMLVEAQRADRNERVQRARGGVEPQGDVYNVMRIAYPAVFLAMIAEGVWRSAHAVSPLGNARLAAAGLVLFILAKSLKWWAVLSLGRSWTFAGKKHALVAGRYRWYVWPGYGPRSASKYGKLLGGSTFVIAR